MSSELQHRVDRAQTHRLVRLTGVLDTDTATDLRSLLLDVLADQPEAVVVDVTELRATDPTAVAVLRDVHRIAADWPRAHLALCDARDTGAWRDTGWPIWSDSGKAFAASGAPDEASRLSLSLEPSVDAARRSRDLITEACARWNRPELVGPGCIVVTELVNNVVAHARTRMVVLLAAHRPGLSVAVRDESVTPPVFTGEPAPTTAPGGRGMLIIDSMAGRWGSLPLTRGKVVWALLEADPTPRSTATRHEPGTPRHVDRTAQQSPQRYDRAAGNPAQRAHAGAPDAEPRHRGARSHETGTFSSQARRKQNAAAAHTEGGPGPRAISANGGRAQAWPTPPVGR